MGPGLAGVQRMNPWVKESREQELGGGGSGMDVSARCAAASHASEQDPRAAAASGSPWGSCPRFLPPVEGSRPTCALHPGCRWPARLDSSLLHPRMPAAGVLIGEDLCSSIFAYRCFVIRWCADVVQFDNSMHQTDKVAKGAIVVDCGGRFPIEKDSKEGVKSLVNAETAMRTLTAAVVADGGN